MKMTKQDLIYEVRDYFNITLGLMLYTLGFTVFLLPYEIVTGGIAGISAIVFYSTGFPVQYTFFIINAALIILALKTLGWKFLTKTIYATFMLTFMLEVAQEIVVQPDGTFYKLLGEGNDFMSLVIGCIITGTALAVVFLNNGSTGGTDIVAAVVNKFHNISLGKALIMVDFCIIGSCLFIDSFGAIWFVYHAYRMSDARLCDVLATPVGTVYDILEEVSRDSLCHKSQDRPHANHPRWSWLLDRSPYQGALLVGKEARECADIPYSKTNRP